MLDGNMRNGKSLFLLTCPLMDTPYHIDISAEIEFTVRRETGDCSRTLFLDTETALS
jgi:hypothetical protein